MILQPLRVHYFLVHMQAHNKEKAPDAEFQGCCLHSINVVYLISSSTIGKLLIWSKYQQILILELQKNLGF